MRPSERNYLTKLLFAAAVLWLLAACSPNASSEALVTSGSASGGEENKTVYYESESVIYTPEELYAGADVILAGRVEAISLTRWNQDSGAYWTETTEEGGTAAGEKLTTTHSAWPVYEVEVAVTRLIVDEVSVGSEVTLTLLGKSPVDAANSEAAEGIWVEADSVDLQVGQEVIVFARQTELAWRDPDRPIELVTGPDGSSFFDIGRRSVITLMGVYANAYLVKGSDGLYHPAAEATNRTEPVALEGLIQKIARIREVLN